MNVMMVALTLALGALPATPSRTEQVANGATTQFFFSFKTASTSHVKVYLDGAVQTTGFSTALNGNQDSSPGGSVTFGVAPSNGKVVRIERTRPVSQDSVWTPMSAFKGATLGAALDNMVMIDQQLDRDKATLSGRVCSGGQVLTTNDGINLICVNDSGTVGVADSATVTATGASAARALRDLFADEVNVKNFLPAGQPDGTTDNTAGVQAAINTGKNVFFPPGIYKVSALTVTTNRQHLTGTLLSWLSSNTDGVSVLKITNNRVVVRDLAIFNNGPNNVALDVGSGASYSEFHNVRLVGSGNPDTSTFNNDTGLRYWNSSYVTFHGVTAEKFKRGIVDDGGNGGISFTDSWASDNYDGFEALQSVHWKGGVLAHNRHAEALIGVRKHGTWDASHTVFTPDSYNQQRANAVFIGTHFETDADLTGPMIQVGDYTANGSTAGLSALYLDGCFIAWNSAARYPVEANTGKLIAITNTEVTGYSANKDAVVGVPNGNFTQVLMSGTYWGVGTGARPLWVKNFGTQTIEWLVGVSHDEYGASTLSPYAQKRLIIMSTNRTDDSIARLRLATVKADGTAVDRMTFQSGVDVGNIDIDPAKARLRFGGPILTAGAGSPEGVVSATVGSVYMRTDGGAGTSHYVKESGSGNTGWVAK